MACTQSIEWAKTLESNPNLGMKTGASWIVAKGPRSDTPIMCDMHSGVVTTLPELIHAHHDSVTTLPELIHAHHDSVIFLPNDVVISLAAQTER